VLDTALGGHDVLLVAVVRFLVVVVIDVTGRDYSPLRALLSPLLAALGIILGALDGEVGWHCSAIAGDRFPIA
jgi:hypothetical protein